MYFKGNDKVWLIVNTADYVCGLMLDTALYELYTEEVTDGAYADGRIKSIDDFKKVIGRFSVDHADDFQIDDVYDIAMGVIDMVESF